MNFKLIMVAILLVAGVFTISACKKTVTEKAAEQGLERATGGQVDVDINKSKEEVTIETEEGKMQVGSNLNLPADWPADVFVPAGEISSVSTINNSHSITVICENSIEEIKKSYQDQFEEDGWTETMSMRQQGVVLLGASKDDRQFSLSLTSENNKTTAVVVVNSQ